MITTAQSVEKCWLHLVNLQDKTVYIGGRNNPHIKNRGVYFLCFDGTVVYIGSSSNVWARIGKHMHEQKKKWDEWFYVQCENYLEVESQLIKAMHPKYNQHHNECRDRSYRIKIAGKLRRLAF